MERGVIEGAEWINCQEDKKLGLHKTAKHYYTPGMHEPVTGGQLMFNSDVWAKLPPDLQEIVKVARVYATTHAQSSAFNRETAQACQELLKEGVQMHRMPDDVLKNFLDEWEKIQAEYAAKNPFYKKVMDSQKAYAGKIVPFSCRGSRPTTWPATTTGRTRSTSASNAADVSPCVQRAPLRRPSVSKRAGDPLV